MYTLPSWPRRTLGCCSKPAYEKVFLNATPLISCVSVMEPPLMRFMPIIFSFRSSSSMVTASTTSFLKKSLGTGWVTPPPAGVTDAKRERCRAYRGPVQKKEKKKRAHTGSAR